MEMQAVKSESVRKLGWEDNKCYVEFMSGAKGYYDNVPQSMFEAIKTAKSIGHQIFAQLKSRPDSHPWVPTK